MQKVGRTLSDVGSHWRNSDRLSWTCARLVPAGSLMVLLVWQLTALIPDSKMLLEHPSLLVAAGCIRALLYAAFLAVPIAALVLHDVPDERDGRMTIRIVAVTATFLLATLGVFAPAGPLLLRSPTLIADVAMGVTIFGVLVAIAAATSLGLNFAIGPQSRVLVTRGPYRLVRHPMYLAELLMSGGVLVVGLHLTLLLGVLVVLSLQVIRIHAEEKLLVRSNPAFAKFVESTRYRLVPLVW
jgi:protein-S-isoprenylcysteine O-methyltransferase Ste14